jgi:hypothetical protein
MPAHRSLGWVRPRVPHKGRVLKVAPAGLDPEIALVRRPVSLRPMMGRRYDQQALGSCVGQAVAKCIEMLLRRQGLDVFVPSRLAIYHEARRALGTLAEDSGAVIADALASVSGQGFAPEALWTYDPQAFACEPSSLYRESATSRRLVNHEPLGHDLASIYWTLAAGLPVAFGIEVYPSFRGDEAALTGVLPMPGPDERAIGGHAMVLTDYDPQTGWFGFINSWGDWGPLGEGFGWVRKEYILDPGLCGELHAVNAVRVLGG